jgi:hypothetical protein
MIVEASHRQVNRVDVVARDQIEQRQSTLDEASLLR